MKIDYDKIAQNYSKYRESDSGVIQNILEIGSLDNNSIVLEIGCGTGNYISEICDALLCNCYGIDSSKKMLNEGRGKNKKIDFLEGNAEDLKFKDDFFDLTFSVDTIHHLNNHLKYFNEAFRVLKFGGLLATFTDSEDTIRRREPLAVYFPETVNYELRRYPPIEKLKALSRQVGFKILSEQVLETRYILKDIEKYKNRAFSCLRLIPEAVFQNGIGKMEDDLKRNGSILCVSRNYVIWNQKKD